MSVAGERVEQVLEGHGLAGSIQHFDTPMPSAAAAAEQLGCEVGAVANSLLFKVADETVLIVISGADRVDVGKVARLFGVGKKKVRRADPDLVLQVTGQRVGGVAPIGHPSPVRTLIDAGLARYAVVWTGGGDEFSMFSTSLAELTSITGGDVVDVATVARVGGS